MALDNLYVDTSQVGTGFLGTSGDPYSWADFVAKYDADWNGSAGGVHYHVKTPTTYDPGSLFSMASVGSWQKPIIIEGYQTTISDRGYAVFDFATSNQYFQIAGTCDCVFLRNLDVTSNRLSSQTLQNLTVNGSIVNCKSFNTENTTNGGGAIVARGLIKDCYAKTRTIKTAIGSSNQAAIYLSTLNATAINCVADVSSGTGSGFNMYVNYAQTSLTNCIVIGNGSASCNGAVILSSANPKGSVINNLTCYDVENCVYVYTAGTSTGNDYGNSIIGLVGYTVGGYGVALSDTTKHGLVSMMDCAIGNATSGRNNAADMVDLNQIVLTANPFTDSAAGDFSLNNTAGGGALCRTITPQGGWYANMPDPTNSIGAVQLAGGGSTTINPPQIKIITSRRPKLGRR